MNASGITMLNEVGLDPGIDHMLAMECFDEVHGKGGKVSAHLDFCLCWDKGQHPGIVSHMTQYNCTMI